MHSLPLQVHLAWLKLFLKFIIFSDVRVEIRALRKVFFSITFWNLGLEYTGIWKRNKFLLYEMGKRREIFFSLETVNEFKAYFKPKK